MNNGGSRTAARGIVNVIETRRGTGNKANRCAFKKLLTHLCHGADEDRRSAGAHEQVPIDRTSVHAQHIRNLTQDPGYDGELIVNDDHWDKVRVTV